MGNNRTTYIGPYIKLLKVPTETIKKTKNFVACINDKCTEFGKHRHGKFCIECSQALANQETIDVKEVELDIPSIMEEFGNVDLFFNLKIEKISLLIPNAIPEELRKYLTYIEDNTDIKAEIEIPDVRLAIMSLTYGYKDFLLFLYKKGIKYESKCGIVNYYY